MQFVLAVLAQSKAELVRRCEANQSSLSIQLGDAVIVLGFQDEASGAALLKPVRSLTHAQLLHVQVLGRHKAADRGSSCELLFQAQLIFQRKCPIEGCVFRGVTPCGATAPDVGCVPALDLF